MISEAERQGTFSPFMKLAVEGKPTRFVVSRADGTIEVRDEFGSQVFASRQAWEDYQHSLAASPVDLSTT